MVLGRRQISFGAFPSIAQLSVFENMGNPIWYLISIDHKYVSYESYLVSNDISKISWSLPQPAKFSKSGRNLSVLYAFSAKNLSLPLSHTHGRHLSPQANKTNRKFGYHQVKKKQTAEIFSFITCQKRYLRL